MLTRLGREHSLQRGSVSSLMQKSERGQRVNMQACKPVKEKCSRKYIVLVPYTKHNLHSHAFHLYDWGWDVHYWLSNNSDFGVNIDH
jgi:hypothetical protein